MTPINKKRLAVGLFSVSCLNFSFISTYPIGRAFASDEKLSSELFQSAEMDRFQIASRPPWEQPSDGTSSYILPPWGLTVNDFVVTRQMPLSSGRREVLLSSPSTGSEQRLFINLPNSGDFQLYEMAFNRALVSGSDSLFSEPETRAKLQNFNVKFSNNALSEVVLADGTNARFTADTAVIKSSSGETIETFRLQNNSANLAGALVAVQKANEPTIYSNIKLSGQQDPLSDSLVLAQSQNSCEENTQRSMDGISNSMAPWSSQMSSSSSELIRAVGWTIGHGSETLKNSANLSDSRLPELTCRPPVQCEERRVSGGSEIRTDLFDIPHGASEGEVVLTYEFFTIPDSIEMYFDGGRVLSVGPVSGQGSRTFRLPANAQQVGITLKGNDNVNTQWWYTISCSQGESQLAQEAPACDFILESDLSLPLSALRADSGHHFYYSQNKQINTPPNSPSLQGRSPRPTFESLLQHYPIGDYRDVKKKIGGHVNHPAFENTCAIRLSRSLNYASSNNRIGYTSNATVSGEDNYWYFYRVNDIVPYLNRHFGVPNITALGNIDQSKFIGKKGIIHFVVTGWRDATGHVDLWDGENCASECYFDRASSISLWEMPSGTPISTPPASPLTPTPNPQPAPTSTPPPSVNPSTPTPNPQPVPNPTTPPWENN